MGRFNKNSNKQKFQGLDLHGYSVEDAEAALDSYLHQQAQSSAPKLKIMTGKGKGKVQKAVIAYLKKAGYTWEHEKMENGSTNSGIIVVHMN